MPSRRNNIPSVPGSHASAAATMRRFSANENLRRFGRSGISKLRLVFDIREAWPLTVEVSIAHHPLAPRSALYNAGCWYHLILTRGAWVIEQNLGAIRSGKRQVQNGR